MENNGSPLDITVYTADCHVMGAYEGSYIRKCFEGFCFQGKWLSNGAFTTFVAAGWYNMEEGAVLACSARTLWGLE